MEFAWTQLKPMRREAIVRIWGLDDILSDGFSRGQCSWWKERLGPARTTLALQFLLEGAKAGRNVSTLPFPKPHSNCGDGAASHGCRSIMN